MSVWHLLLGLALGAAGAALHLAVTRYRASWIVRRQRRWAPLAAYPLGLLGPALAVLGAAWIAPQAAWATPVGILAARTWLLKKAVRP